jgi:hypothetical protein
MNIPGGRYGAVSWTDGSGNFWLFGGQGFDSTGAFGFLNDLWEFNPAAKTWTWISGSKAVNQPGVYGTIGVPASGFMPGNRFEANSWIDGSGNLWLFGGWGSSGDLNDLWFYNPSTEQWTWMNGSNQAGQNGVYGTIGAPAPGNTPNSRSGAVSWTDANGNFWLMGGEGYSSTSQATTESVSRAHPLDFMIWSSPALTYGDLWEFDVTAQEWILISLQAENGVAGTLGVPSTANGPTEEADGAVVGATGAIAYTDKNGDAWILSPTNLYLNFCNALMDFNPSTLEWAWMGGSCSYLGVYGAKGVPAAGNIPGGRENSVGWTDRQGNLWLFGGSGSDSAGNTGDLNDLWMYQPSATTLPPAITPYVEEYSGAYDFPLSFEIYNGMTNAVFYYTTDGSTPNTNSAETSDWITLSAPATLNVIAVAPGYPNSGVASAVFTQEPTAATPTFSVASGTYNSVQMVTLNDTTPNASFEYSVNLPGDPNLYFQPYSGPISVSSTETLTAIASADGYNLSARATATYTIPTGFTVAAAPGSLSVTGGESGTTTVSVTPLNGFRSTVGFTCSGLPAGASCSFAPQSVTPSGGVASTTLTVTTSASTAAVDRSRGLILPGSALAVAFCFLGCKKRRRLEMLLFLAASVASLGLLTGCGGSSPPTRQPVTSTVTVLATSGSLQHSTSFSLTVN